MANSTVPLRVNLVRSVVADSDKGFYEQLRIDANIHRAAEKAAADKLAKDVAKEVLKEIKLEAQARLNARSIK